MAFEDQIQIRKEYIKALKSERRKIQVFERELPLCLELVTQAIEGCLDYFNGESDCSEETSIDDAPVLEEFIPMKKTLFQEDEEHEPRIESFNRKSDWLRSAQLSIPSPDPVEIKRNGCGAFHPFKKEKRSGEAPARLSAVTTADQAADASSTAETGGGSSGCGGSKNEDKGQSNRKTRRCWSPELHRRFLHSLQQLGGSHVATPKQIRELMKVDGLTNDEVKSHLQKYRLHTRRPSPTNVHNNNNPQTPQFVVVGGIWMPPPEYNSMATNSTPSSCNTMAAVSTGIYAPIASHPPLVVEASTSRNKSDSGEKDSGHSHVASPSASSSTRTTTTSHGF